MHFVKLEQRLGEVTKRYLYLPLWMGETENSVVAVYPWLQGLTLEEQMEQGLTQVEYRRIARHLADAVRIINVSGIAHLDLKPTNVIAHKRFDQVYIHLIDLDSAQIDGVGLRDEPRWTPYYFAPEHLDKKFGQLSTKSDSFSLGIMLFKLLFGRHPFTGLEKYKEAIITGPLVVEANPYQREVVQRVVDCLEVDPVRRPTAGRVHNAFHEAYREGDDDLEAKTPGELWEPRVPSGSTEENQSYVEIVPLAINEASEYTYFETVELDWQQFRAVKLERFSGSLIRLLHGPAAWWLVVLQDQPEVEISGVVLHQRGAVRLGTYQEIRIGLTRFQFRVVPY
jgi:serine/threonine protein kinase